MVTRVYLSDTHINENNDATLLVLYPRLLSLARRFVYRYKIPSWWGQEEDIAYDVAQETARRLIERSLKTARGEALPIEAIEKMMIAIALNYIRDLRRHDQRVIRTQSYEHSHRMNSGAKELTSLLEIATENVYRQSLFLAVAREIANFPCKQRNAMLTDLANRMSFNSQPTLLQKAFLDVGIDLRAYQQPLPDDPVKRARHTSLLSYAYKRLAHVLCTQQYI